MLVTGEFGNREELSEIVLIIMIHDLCQAFTATFAVCKPRKKCRNLLNKYRVPTERHKFEV
eukprot:6128451-Amphidinium_carterae.1